MQSNFTFAPLEPAGSFTTYSAKGLRKSAQSHYHCLSLEQIKSLPVRELASKDAVLCLWATAPMLPQALETMQAWGFSYKTSGAWAKQSKTGRAWSFGTGYHLRCTAEFFAIGTIGKRLIGSHSIRNLIVAPTGRHSEKPTQLHAMLEQLYPCARRCELFARQHRNGWECWGDELGAGRSGGLCLPLEMRAQLTL